MHDRRPRVQQPAAPRQRPRFRLGWAVGAGAEMPLGHPGAWGGNARAALRDLPRYLLEVRLLAGRTPGLVARLHPTSVDLAVRLDEAEESFAVGAVQPLCVAEAAQEV